MNVVSALVSHLGNVKLVKDLDNVIRVMEKVKWIAKTVKTVMSNVKFVAVAERSMKKNARIAMEMVKLIVITVVEMENLIVRTVVEEVVQVAVEKETIIATIVKMDNPNVGNAVVRDTDLWIQKINFENTWYFEF